MDSQLEAFEFMVQPAILLLAASIYFVLAVLDRQLSDEAKSTHLYKRIQPILPEILAIVLAAATHKWPNLAIYTIPDQYKSPIMVYAIVPLWIGMLSSKAYKIVTQSILGNDKLLTKDDKEAAAKKVEDKKE